MSRSPLDLPEPPASLPPDRARELTALTEAAVRREHREVGRALEAALEQIPRVLRGGVRKVVGL